MTELSHVDERRGPLCPRRQAPRPLELRCGVRTLPSAPSDTARPSVRQRHWRWAAPAGEASVDALDPGRSPRRDRCVEPASQGDPTPSHPGRKHCAAGDHWVVVSAGAPSGAAAVARSAPPASQLADVGGAPAPPTVTPRTALCGSASEGATVHLGVRGRVPGPAPRAERGVAGRAGPPSSATRANAGWYSAAGATTRRSERNRVFKDDHVAGARPRLENGASGGDRPVHPRAGTRWSELEWPTSTGRSCATARTTRSCSAGRGR